MQLVSCAGSLRRTEQIETHRHRNCTAPAVPDLSFWMFGRICRRTAPSLRVASPYQLICRGTDAQTSAIACPWRLLSRHRPGNHREPLFGSDADRDALNDIVADVLARVLSRIHAFCWMTNHLHALIQVSDQPLGKTMQRICMRYSRYRHKRLRTTGHLIERRYKAKLVDVDEYFLTLLRYIHMNPVKAHVVSDPRRLPLVLASRLSRRR
jgi:REP element-mobilizing transposase RayT